MILYLLSVLLVCFSSYFLTSYFAGENETEGIFYLPLCAFANVVLTFEILSLFSAITVNNVLLMNFIFAGISAVIFYKSGKKFFKPDIRNFICRFKNSVILDKYLLFLSLGFLCLIAVSLFLIIFIPPINGDAD